MALVILALAFALALSGCPQERPGATKEIPPQRVPPAVSIEPSPPALDGGVAPPASPTRRP